MFLLREPSFRCRDVPASSAYPRRHNQSGNNRTQACVKRSSPYMHDDEEHSKAHSLNDDSPAECVAYGFSPAANGHEQEEGDNANNDVRKL